MPSGSNPNGSAPDTLYRELRWLTFFRPSFRKIGFYRLDALEPKHIQGCFSSAAGLAALSAAKVELPLGLVARIAPAAVVDRDGPQHPGQRDDQVHCSTLPW